MKFLATVAIALLLLSLESVVVRYLGLAVARIDVTVALVVFLGIRASVLEGAFSSFAVGYLLDVMTGRPTGLYTFLAVLVFILVKVGSMLVDARSLPSFLAFVAAADLGHSLLAAFFTWLTSKEGAAAAASLTGLLAQLPLTVATALLLWPLLRRLDPATERPEVGALR